MAENWKTLAALFVIPTFLCVLAAIDTQNFPNPIRTNTPVIVVRFECRVPRHLLGSSSHEFRTHSLELKNPRNESMAKITTAGLVTNLHSDATADGHADYMYWQNNNLTVVTPLTDGGEYRCIIEYTPDGRAQHNETPLITLDKESVGETKRDRDGFSAETFAADHVLVTWRPPVTGKLIHSTVSVETGGSGLELYPNFPLFTANGEEIPFVYSKEVLLSNFSTPRGTAGNFTISVYVSKNLCKPTCRYLCEISYPSCVGPDASNCFCDGADSRAPTLTTPLSLPTIALKPTIAMENASTTLVPSGSKYPTADPKQGESGNSNSSENCAGWRAGLGVSLGACVLLTAAFIFVYFCRLRKYGNANDAKGQTAERKPLIEHNDVRRKLSDILNSADSRVQNKRERIIEEIKRLHAVAEMRQRKVTTIGEKENLNEKLDHLSESMEEKVGRLTGSEQAVSRLITSPENKESISNQDLVRLESDLKRLKEENHPNKMSDDFLFHKNKNVSANVNTSYDRFKTRHDDACTIQEDAVRPENDAEIKHD